MLNCIDLLRKPRPASAWRVAPLVCFMTVLQAQASAVQPSSDPASQGSDQQWSGEVDGSFSFNRSTYTTRAMGVSVDVGRPMGAGKLDGELRYDRESIVVENSPAQVEKDRYDANIKYKHFWAETPYYSYVSPRVRGDRFGFYQRARALRLGGGRQFLGEADRWEVNLELGTGYREAHLSTNEEISETLYSFTAKARWVLNENLLVKLNWMAEASNREAYQTITLSLRNKLSDRLGLKYELLQRRSFTTQDAPRRDKEFQADIGLSYAF